MNMILKKIQVVLTIFAFLTILYLSFGYLSQDQIMISVNRSSIPNKQINVKSSKLECQQFQQANHRKQYKFIPPPYNEKLREIQVKENVCIEADSDKHGRSRIVIYNSNPQEPKLVNITTNSASSHFPAGNIHYINWPVIQVTGGVPKGRTMADTPAYFFSQVFPGNIFHFFEQGIQGGLILISLL